MKDYTEKLMETKTLANGVKLSFFDFCKPMAADRWYIKIICRLELAIPHDKLAGSVLDKEGQAAFFDHYEGVLVHEFSKERNFVDVRDKDNVVSAIISQVNDNSLGYVANPVFAENLFNKKVDAFIQEQSILARMAEGQGDEEAEEPADFSACFKD